MTLRPNEDTPERRRETAVCRLGSVGGRASSFLVFVLLVSGCGWDSSPPVHDRLGAETDHQAGGDMSPRRIVSMAPSITETVFALGCGDRLVGVTDFCSFPPEAKAIPKIGGYLNPNWEAILRLQPDLVIVPAGQQDFSEKLARFRLKSVTVDHRSVDGVFDSLEILGRVFGVEDRAKALASAWRQRLAHLEERWKGKPRPRVLFVIERSIEPGRLRNICAAGPDGFLDRIISIAGGENVLHDAPVPFPMLSAEGVLKLNPEVIIDSIGGIAAQKIDRATILSGWQQVKNVAAVRNGRICLLEEDVPLVPGPRMIELAERLAQCFHPESAAPRPAEESPDQP